MSETNEQPAVEPARASRALRQPRRLVFCFDGSWNKLDVKQHPTNVVLVAESMPPIDKNGRDQIVWYDEGVGTASNETLRGGAFGKGLVANVQDAYRFLIFNYQPGDEIFVFGFSRGAFTARTFIGFIKCAGIVSVNDANQIRRAWDLYKKYADRDEDEPDEVLEFRRLYCPSFCVTAAELAWRQQKGLEVEGDLLKVRYCGVWDTVGSLGCKAVLATFDRRPDKRYKQHDTQLSNLVKSGRHAVSLDERRVHFMPTLWRNVRQLNLEAGHDPYSADAPYQEMWFAGDHGSVGGGGPERGLSNAALHWILKGAVAKGLEVRLEGRSQIDDIRYRADAPLQNTPAAGLGKNRLGRAALGQALGWLKTKLLISWRAGPSDVSQIHPSTLRRWFLPPDQLGGTLYRPKTLLHLKEDIEKQRGTFTPPNEQSFPRYVVQQGDSLRQIAYRLLGDANRSEEIFALNRDLLDDPDDIFPSDQLRMPLDGTIPQ